MFPPIRTSCIFILFALVLTIPVLFLRRGDSFRLDTDYNAALPEGYFVKLAYKKPKLYLHINPLVSTGISVKGDPSSIVFSPYYALPFILFEPEVAMKIIITMTVFVSGMSMFLFLKHCKVTDLLSLWGGLLFASSGGLSAFIASGRLERFASYATMPLVWLFIMKKRMRMTDIMAVSALFAAMIYSGDIYFPWLICILLAGYQIWSIWVKQKNVSTVVWECSFIFLFALVFIFPKIYFFIIEVLPHFDRMGFIGNTYSAGSVHLPFALLSFIMPLQVQFYDRPFFQRTLGFYYNWYEYYAFVSPLPFLFLFHWGKIWMHKTARLMIFIICVGALYVAMGQIYSPFYWVFRLIAQLQIFRVPQRMVVPLLVPLITLLCIAVDTYSAAITTKKRIYIYGTLIATIIWTSRIFTTTYYATFEPPRVAEKYIADKLRNLDHENYFVASFVCCVQPFLVHNEIATLNYYYGWLPKEAPRFIHAGKAEYDLSLLTHTKPRYLIASSDSDFSVYNYTKVRTKAHISIWKTEEETIRPSL